MAKQDIRLDIDFLDHPKTTKLRRLLGDAGVLALLRLWAFAAKYHPDGCMRDLDATGIKDACLWRRSSDLVGALLEARFLDRSESGEYHLHDWSDHQPYVVHSPERSQKARDAA